MAIELKNLMETLVMQKLDEVIDQLDCCKCEQCRMDMVSYALNRLAPKYVVTNEGSVYSKLDTLSLQFETDMLSTLMQASKVVKAHPRHKKVVTEANFPVIKTGKKD